MWCAERGCVPQRVLRRSVTFCFRKVNHIPERFANPNAADGAAYWPHGRGVDVYKRQMLAVLTAAAFLVALLGAYVGRRVLKKHFVRAGLVQA